MVIYASDSGYENSNYTNDRTIKGGDKRGAYDEMNRVALMLRYPPSIPINQPKLIDQLVSSVDLAPTLLTCSVLATGSYMYNALL